ncbi:diguanylate cyclase [Neorhizobium lilium]|uniref:diguanylate cyclase n=1 Tax=Neorhizobium lilium TaxID=2503024 RepID=A0A444LAM1_9HYPH|nr:sensor domain-containing diguanylate cyclase [Neorhizobium lilium]RWX74674.1 diguanylate cyclase [Neorhizobium lilium]
MLKFLSKLFSRRTSSRRPDAAVDFQTLAEGNNDVIFRCGKDGIVNYVSPSIRLFGWVPEEVLGQGPAMFILPEDLPAVLAVLEKHKAGVESTRISFRLRRKDGTPVWLEASARTVADAVCGSGDVVVVLRDVEERKQLEERLCRLAMTDGLTGLANRRAFDEALESEWLRVRRTKGRLSLLLIDLDHFKGFNDHYGHQVGDDCLRAVASAIQEALQRPADLAARYGGEEIAVILPNTDLAGAVAVAVSVRSAVEALCIPHVVTGAGAEKVTISVGVATALSAVGASIQMPAGLLRAADTALYKAKNNGRNRVETALVLSGDISTSSSEASTG